VSDRFSSRALLAFWLVAAGGCSSAPATDGTHAHQAGGRGAASGEAGVAFQEYGRLGGDFSLTDHRCEPFDLASLRGQVVLLFFGFTLCPDACPLTLSKLAGVHARLGEAGERVRTVLVTVDPERDTPPVVAAYLQQFELPAVGLTGSPAEIAAVASQYGASSQTSEGHDAHGYQVNHSLYLYLIDQQGRLRYLFKQEDGPDRILAGVRQLLSAGT
jgi:protein SCO1/2